MDCIVDGVAKSWTQLSNLHLNSAIHAIYFFNIITWSLSGSQHPSGAQLKKKCYTFYIELIETVNSGYLGVS